MNFLINQIREQKIIEMEVNLEDVIQENSISEKAIIFKVVLDKDVFESKTEVVEYLKDKFYHEYKITESDNSFIVMLNSPSQMDDETEVEIKLRRGVMATAADLLPVMNLEEMRFNDKGEVNLSSKFGTINLSEGLPHIIEVARVAEGEHPAYGKLKITQEHLESMQRNFKSGVTGVDLAINEDHKKNGAFGWFKDIFLSYDKQVLYAQVNWNAKGTTALSEKEYRYFSPEFRFNYKHPHTGVEHGPTLLGGALTNYPFLKMDAITELSNKNNSQGEGNVSKETTIELSVHNEAIVELNGKISEIQGKLDASEARNVELNDKVTELQTTLDKEAKAKTHEKLFAENKINKAQLIALNEGKTMLEVLSLSEAMNPKAKGSDETPSNDVVELSAKEKQIAESLGLTDEEFVNFNK